MIYDRIRYLFNISFCFSWFYNKCVNQWIYANTALFHYAICHTTIHNAGQDRSTIATATSHQAVLSDSFSQQSGVLMSLSQNWFPRISIYILHHRLFIAIERAHAPLLLTSSVVVETGMSADLIDTQVCPLSPPWVMSVWTATEKEHSDCYLQLFTLSFSFWPYSLLMPCPFTVTRQPTVNTLISD